mgnify:CR=1 FL=1
MSSIMLTTMLVLFALSVPIAVAIGMGSIVGILSSDGASLLIVGQQMFTSLDKYPLAAIPFFLIHEYYPTITPAGLIKKDWSVDKDGYASLPQAPAKTVSATSNAATAHFLSMVFLLVRV